MSVDKKVVTRKTVAQRVIDRIQTVRKSRTTRLYSCCRCRKVIAREDRLLREFVPLGGAKIDLPYKQAPRIKCPCGLATILLDGSL